MRLRASLYLLTALVAAIPAASASAAERVFELRTYTAAPGRLGALNTRFREHTVALFKKHGMEIVAFWEPTDKEAGAGDKLVYVLAHASRVAAEASWKAFRDDPEWIKVKSASEVAAGGPLTTRVESVFLAPTDYSPLK